MVTSAWRMTVGLGLAAAMLLGVRVGGAGTDAPAGEINAQVAAWNARPALPQSAAESFENCKTVATEFPKAYKDAVRRVVEMKVAHMVAANRSEFVGDLGKEAPEEEIRRVWRLDILQDLQTLRGSRQAVTKQFQVETAAILCPMLEALAAEAKDGAGRPAVTVRATALLLLTEIPGDPEGKVKALLGLLKRPGLEQGALYLVVREVGRAKVAAAVNDLISVLQSDNQLLVGAAAQALGRIGDEAALLPLLNALTRVGDTTGASPDEAREALLGVIEGIRGVVKPASLVGEKRQARVVAALMRRVLTDADRLVVVAAVDALRQIAACPERLDVRSSDDEFQRGIERVREWWLRQPGAQEAYQAFASVP
jgi:hypothetical protein